MIWEDATSTSGPLTAEGLRAAIKAVYEHTEPHPCKLGQHVVSPRALTRPGVYWCASCGAPIEIPYPLCER